MRREFTLSATNPRFTVELTFFPSTIIVLNNTDKSVYLRIGSTDIPNATFFDREILPAASGIPSNIALPNNSYQFAGFLPTPTDTTKNVKIIFQGTANPFNNKFMPPNQFGGSGLDSGSRLMSGLTPRHWQEYRLNALNPRQVMSLAFMADMCFILNNSDAFLYINQGGTGTPSSVYNDLTIPPTSYTIFEPHGGFDFAAFLDSPSQKDCFIIFCYGYADEYMAIKQIMGDWDWYLPPLTIPGLQYYFDFNLPSRWCQLFDFTLSNFGWQQTVGTYVPGVGFVAALVVMPNIYQLAISSSPNPFGDCNADTMTVYYSLNGIAGGQANTWRALKHPATNVQTFNNAILPANTEITFALNGLTINGASFAQLNNNGAQLTIVGFAIEGDVIGGVPPVFNYGVAC